MYDIEYTLEAMEDLKRFRKYEQQLIADQIDEQLLHERRTKPATENDYVLTASQSSSCE